MNISTKTVRNTNECTHWCTFFEGTLANTSISNVVYYAELIHPMNPMKLRGACKHSSSGFRIRLGFIRIRLGFIRIRLGFIRIRTLRKTRIRFRPRKKNHFRIRILPNSYLIKLAFYFFHSPGIVDILTLVYHFCQ